MKKMDIFIGSYARDFPYLKYCLRSVNRFAEGFHKLHLFIPVEDLVALYREVGFDRISRENWKLHPVNVWPGKGMLHHLYLVMTADKLAPEADFIFHMDSDCIFTERVTPEDFLDGDKPVLMYGSYQFLGPDVKKWQDCVHAALGWKPVNEFMRRHGIVHIPKVYEQTRIAIERHTKRSLSEYLYSGRNQYPQSFCDFPTLGEIAWRHFRDRYHWINVETDPQPRSRIHQSWSFQMPTTDDIKRYAKLGLLT
jgi:hypothetical protein